MHYLPLALRRGLIVKIQSKYRRVDKPPPRSPGRKGDAPPEDEDYAADVEAGGGAGAGADTGGYAAGTKRNPFGRVPPPTLKRFAAAMTHPPDEGHDDEMEMLALLADEEEAQRLAADLELEEALG